MIQASEVQSIVKKCLFNQEEIDAEGKPKVPWIAAEGVVSQFGFNKERIDENAARIRELLQELPIEFQPTVAGGGGGWTFLNACQDKNGELWGQQRDVDELLTLGIASGWASISMPRDMWNVLPGGVPYFEVMHERVPVKPEPV